MRFGLAFPVLLTAVVSGVGAAVTVFIEWSHMISIPDAVSPALWAARAYLGYFDVWAAAAFLPSLMFCRWIRIRLDPVRHAPSAPSGPVRPEPGLPLQGPHEGYCPRTALRAHPVHVGARANATGADAGSP
jgi:hypothetical protein